MFKEGLLDKTLRFVKKFIPRSVFSFFQPAYHAVLAYAGAVIFGFPSHGMKVIGVTGTKGKSTVVFYTAKILEGMGYPVASISSLGFTLLGEAGASRRGAALRARSEGGEQSEVPSEREEWPNSLKMTMPGRFKIHKFMAEAKKAGCKFFVLEVTSEGIKQKRHLGINFDCAVFTNLHKEHLEAHGSFENYLAAKQELFKITPGIHVLNCDDPYFEKFSEFGAGKTIFYGIRKGDIRAEAVRSKFNSVDFEVYGTKFHLNIGGEFNVYNALAALSVGAMYGGDLPSFASILSAIPAIPGRMEFIQKEPFAVVIDYAHTPDSLKAVYKSLKDQSAGKLICVLGAAGGGRDKWKRPEFGRIAGECCDDIILTNEDPYDENPESILEQIASGFSATSDKRQATSYKILDRREAITKAISLAKPGDIVIITGKGSEISMAIAGGKKIPWSDRKTAEEALRSMKA